MFWDSNMKNNLAVAEDTAVVSVAKAEEEEEEEDAAVGEEGFEEDLKAITNPIQLRLMARYYILANCTVIKNMRSSLTVKRESSLEQETKQGKIKVRLERSKQQLLKELRLRLGTHKRKREIQMANKLIVPVISKPLYWQQTN